MSGVSKTYYEPFYFCFIFKVFFWKKDRPGVVKLLGVIGIFKFYVESIGVLSVVNYVTVL